MEGQGALPLGFQGFQCRPYQEEALQRLEEAVQRGGRRLLVVWATGLGKAVMLTKALARLWPYFRERFNGQRKRAMVIAHREELLEQLLDKINREMPDAHASIEQANREANPWSRVVIASIQTLTANDGARLKRFNPGDFYAIVTDEAHHYLSPLWKNALQHFRLIDGPDGVALGGDGPLLLGCTATPNRSDGIGLSAIFDEVVHEMPIREGVRHGWLAPPRAWIIPTGVNLQAAVNANRLHTDGSGDFREGELARVVNVPDRNALAVRAYQAKADGKRCIAFCANVQHAKDLAEAFRKRGVLAEAVWGDMPRAKRRDVLKRFGDGKIHVISNCNVMTEGYDEPRVEALILARPTASSLVFEQMFGRAIRPWPPPEKASTWTGPRKEFATVIDLVDTTDVPLPNSVALFGLPPNWDPQGRDLLDEVEALERALARQNEQPAMPDGLDLPKGRDVSVSAAASVMREIDLLGLRTQREDIRRMSRNDWVRMPDGSYRLILPAEAPQEGARALPVALVVRQDTLGHWQAFRQQGGRLTRLADGSAVNVIFTTEAEAIALADRFLRAHGNPRAQAVAFSGARWREYAPSQKQREALQAAGMWQDGMTAGEAADLIGTLRNRPTAKMQALLRRIGRWQDGLTFEQASERIDAYMARRSKATLR